MKQKIMKFDPLVAPHRDCAHCEERVLFFEEGDYFHIGKTNEQLGATHYIFFHKECFLEIAGEKFSDKITMENPWYRDKKDNWRHHDKKENQKGIFSLNKKY